MRLLRGRAAAVAIAGFGCGAASASVRAADGVSCDDAIDVVVVGGGIVGCSAALHTSCASRTVTKKEAATRSTAACSPCPVALELAASGALRPESDSPARPPARLESARLASTVDAPRSRRLSGLVGVVSAEVMLRTLPGRPGSDLGGSAGRLAGGDGLRVGPRPLLPSRRAAGGQASVGAARMERGWAGSCGSAVAPSVGNRQGAAHLVGPITTWAPSSAGSANSASSRSSAFASRCASDWQPGLSNRPVELPKPRFGFGLVVLKDA